ncbi:hypothetical protein F2P81_020646 [Scophthalmus maximus]|uniref:Uncharacterized protein n=1 Tax=Scophthalmus maximus TaxID=52904 RepID=A0A6A4S6N2_SCOMX|nr:hypothetical protein F2P81_020646 [Scophthalmus maximus]
MIHVFLGAPPPSSGPISLSEAGEESERRPPAGWGHLELTWTDGRLRPVTDQTPAERLTSPEPEPEEEERCSALVHEYLDGCFPAAQPEPEPEPPEPEPPYRSRHQPSAAVPPLCTQTQYLTTWTLSQALILRGRRSTKSTSSPDKAPPPQRDQTPPSACCSTLELFSPLPPSPAELLCSGPSAEEGGVVLQSTADGLLCSQEAESSTALDPPAKSPDLKKARLSEGSRSEAPSDRTAAGLRRPTTSLVHCHNPGVRYSVLVAVVHPCHLKEIKVKSGPSTGTFVPLASIVVTDQSGVDMKVVLWRRAAFWALTVNPGDVLLITGLQLNEDRWRGETVLQSTFCSKLLSLGQVTACSSPPALQHVDARSLRSLCGFLRERRPLLVSLPRRAPQDLNRLPYATLRSLRVNTLVHALLRVTHTHTNAAAVWDFHVLLVREGVTSDLPELHSTSWSSVRALDPGDRRAQNFFAPRRNQTGNGSGCSVELDLDTLLSQKHSGDVELRVKVTAFHFLDAPSSHNALQLVLDGSTPLDGIVAALGGDVSYTGCGRCSSELSTDANGIYGPCYRCLPHVSVRRYYRRSSTLLQINCTRAQVSPSHRCHHLRPSAPPGSEVKLIQAAAERIQMLVALPRKTFIVTIRSHFLCDENSVPLSQDFTLLDLQFPPDDGPPIDQQLMDQ